MERSKLTAYGNLCQGQLDAAEVRYILHLHIHQPPEDRQLGTAASALILFSKGGHA